MSTDIREFLQRVLPWPGDDAPGFVNVHAQLHIDGKTPWTGTPTRDVDALLRQVHAYLGWSEWRPDIYMCMSRQAKTKPGKGGALKAAKHKDDALALKSIFLDIDVKDPPKGYATLGAAITALTAFYTHFKLPAPTALVMSGGGVHAHWISDRELTPAEWAPYALGLKQAAINFGLLCDAGVTGDSARVLRIPGTFNFKQDPARPVKLLGMKDQDYDFRTDLAALPAIAPAVPHAIGARLTGHPSPVFSGLPIESLAEGIGHEPLPPLDPTPLGKECGWFREALTTGGAGFSQGLWNLTTLAASFMENGHALAHRMARGHPGYSKDETDALWERKLAERSNNGLGWPSCRAIQAEGCGSCATCPHLAAGKSPINLARVPQLRGQVSPGLAVVQNQGGTSAMAGVLAAAPVGTSPSGASLVPLVDADMPDLTYVVRNNIVHKIIEVKERGQPPSTMEAPLFHRPIYNPWAQSHPDALNFITAVDKGTHRDVCILRIQQTTLELERVLLGAGVAPVTNQLKYVKEFIVSWQAKLNEAAAAATNVPFGWHMNENNCEGFSYGSVLYKKDGSRGPIGMIDPKLKEIYGPQGEVQVWWDAFKIITDQQRPGLETIVASAFGAPLMFAAGEYSVLMSVYGESGANKSSAARVGQAIWAKPVLAKEVETATLKSVIHRLGQIKNIPYFWDEIKNSDAQKKAYDVLYVASAGSEGSRLHSDITQQSKGTWQTICGIFSNPSFSNYVLAQNPNTTAGLMRLFEWEEKVPAKNAPGQISSSDAGRMILKLDYNFGQIGKQYSAWLGQNREFAEAAVTENSHWFEKEVFDPTRNTSEERYWIAFAAATMTGAEVANANLGTNFNLAAMRTFLTATIRQQRKRSYEENIQGGSLGHTEQMLTEFLKAYIGNTVRTAKLPMKRPGAPELVELITFPMQGRPCHVHWVLGINQLRLSKSELTRWLRQPHINGDARTMIDGLKKHYFATVARGTLAAGTTVTGGPEQVVTLPVTAGTPLWGLMMSHAGEVNAPDPNAPAPAPSATADTTMLYANPDARS